MCFILSRQGRPAATVLVLAPTIGQLESRDLCFGKRIGSELEDPTHHGDV